MMWGFEKAEEKLSFKTMTKVRSSSSKFKAKLSRKDMLRRLPESLVNCLILKSYSSSLI